MEQDFLDFFNIGNYEHLKAWQHLNKTGNWPKDFSKKIEKMYFSTNWRLEIAGSMAEAYLNTTLNAMETGMSDKS